ncbi:MAG TPA: MotA/TolQ/ExbB proton channel family protein [Phycisphaerae bacterium]|nr:MotA/TolQ/ExbB proton channel family protein [Phycisphaerae bacterium]
MREAQGYRGTKALRAILIAFVLGVCASPVMAQEAAPVQGRSFLEIVREGAEWPGLIIAAMSLVALTIVIEHFWTIRRSTVVDPREIETARELIEARKFRECLDLMSRSRTMFADVLSVALRHGRHGFDAMHQAADERAGAWSSRLFRKVEYLNIIGNLGPLMGLLGTVLGMIRAFGQMRAAHGAYHPEDLAGGISLALVNTFLGLGVAIVALGFFGVCRNRVDSLTVAAHAAASDLIEYFRPVAVGAATVEPARNDQPRPAGKKHHSAGAGSQALP